ncbi:hypothetical protein ACDZ28_09070 [Paenibacillus sp. RS8]|uniref:Uncharacterized protein n=1 Tax=Paenibacillus odorifer TaxID=189426 RepID=A0A1R0Y9I5_9BACL|nr:hypothetical protein [Paenibacillus odorifer]OMD44019.1 hypothetical protein BSK52_00260 [Paenibacillus odorifer]
MKVKLIFIAIKKVALIVISLILLYLCFTVTSLRLFIPVALIPVYFAFVPGKRGMTSMIKLLLIMITWLGLMVAANGPEMVKQNFIQGYENTK